MAANKTSKATEFTKPALAADFLIRLTENPERSITQIAKDCGFPQKTADQLERRLSTRYLPVLDEVKKVTTKSLLRKIDKALPLILDRMSDADLLQNITLRDAAVAAGVLIEKRQLLMGEPTQITSFEERKTIGELGPALLAEIKKRGQNPVDVAFEDIPREGSVEAGVLSVSARRQAKREDRGRV